MRQHIHTWTINEPHHHPFKIRHPLHISTNVLQNLCCFNHWVVALVADKLKRQWLGIVYYAKCIREEASQTILQLWSSNYWTCIFERATPASIKECAIDLADIVTIEYLWENHHKSITLQKQVNHRVVALVADKPERQWLLEVCFDFED